MTEQRQSKQKTINRIGEELRVILYNKLSEYLGEDIVETKWKASKESSDDFDSTFIYTPETDIIVKPLNIDARISDNNALIEEALVNNKEFLRRINYISARPFEENNLNKNPRCFIAIEVAGSGSEKHLLGDMFNSCVLGKIGIVVATDKAILKTYLRLFEYVNFAYNVEKIKFYFSNLVIVDGQDFLALIEELTISKSETTA